MKNYRIELGCPAAVVNSNGDTVWGADTSEELVDLLIHELAAESRVSKQLRQERDALQRIVARYSNVVNRADALFAELLRDNGDRCMLGNKHVADIKALRGKS